MDDEPVSVAHLPPLLDQPWQRIDPRYRSVLRVSLTLKLLLPALLGTAALLWAPEPLVLAARLLLPCLAALWLLLMLIWIPRRVKRTEYLLREKDIHKRTGYWWHSTTSTGHNRIQHIEVTQGPLERLYGLSKLVLYTAGGGQSDIIIPGLPTDTAHRLKNYLTEKIAAEELADDGEP